MKSYKVIIVAYPGMTMLDAIGPNDVLGNSPYFDVQWVTTLDNATNNKGMVGTTNDMQNITLSGLQPYSSVNSADIVLIPGGAGDKALMQNHAFIEWLKDIDKLTLLTTSVCTGTLVLAQAGLLEGRKACTHWACLEELKALGAIPQRRRFVQSDKYVSASGVSSGIDMALYIIQSLVSKQHARDIRFGIEYFPNQYHLLSSYSLPHFVMNKLARRFHKVFDIARAKFL